MKVRVLVLALSLSAGLSWSAAALTHADAASGGEGVFEPIDAEALIAACAAAADLATGRSCTAAGKELRYGIAYVECIREAAAKGSRLAKTLRYQRGTGQYVILDQVEIRVCRVHSGGVVDGSMGFFVFSEEQYAGVKIAAQLSFNVNFRAGRRGHGTIKRSYWQGRAESGFPTPRPVSERLASRRSSYQVGFFLDHAVKVREADFAGDVVAEVQHSNAGGEKVWGFAIHLTAQPLSRLPQALRCVGHYRSTISGGTES